MTQEQEGVIKFSYTKIEQKTLSKRDVEKLQKWRALLFEKKLIGEEANTGIGFGNISKRYSENSFIISASGTGGKEKLTVDDYALVSDCDLESFSLKYSGELRPSSESFTHFVIYKAYPSVNYVFHIHSKTIWQYMIEHDYPAVPDSIEYGTPQMAQFFFKQTEKKSSYLYVMKGHQDGVLSFADGALSAGEQTLNILEKAQRN